MPKTVRPKKTNKRSKRPKSEKGENIYYYVLDIFSTPEKEDLIKREIYRFSWQIAQMHPETFSSPETVRMFIKRHNYTSSIGFGARTPEKRKRIKLYRRVIPNEVISTANHFLKKEKKIKKAI